VSAGIEITVDTAQLRVAIDKIIAAMGLDTLLSLIGKRQLAWIDQNFKDQGTENKWKALRPNTVVGRRMGSSSILQDKGLLKNSFTDVVIGDAVHVGTANQISKYHQDGTAPYDIRPKTKRALAFMTVGGRIARRGVHHPGLPARPMLPTSAVAERIAIDTLEQAIDKAIAAGAV